MTPLTVDQVHFLEFLLGMWRNVAGGLPQPDEVSRSLSLEFTEQVDRWRLADILHAKGLVA